MNDQHDPTADPDVERWWQWTLVWIAAVVLGGEAGSRSGPVGLLFGLVAGTAVVALGFLAVRAFSLAMAPEGSTQTPPRCLHGRCEGLAQEVTPGRYDFVRRDTDGDTYRCYCGDEYLLTPDAFFGASKMFLVRRGLSIPFKRKRVLGPWRWLASSELREALREETDAQPQSAEAEPVRLGEPPCANKR
jgi:hypothetical protein